MVLSVHVYSQQHTETKERLKGTTNLKKAQYTIDIDKAMMPAMYSVPKQIILAKDTTVYAFMEIETPPTYPGGIEKFYKFMNDNINYPEEAKKKNIQGNVFVSFIVEKNGALTNIRIDRKLGYGTDEEAVRVLKMSRYWNPGIQKGKVVRVRYHIPIEFSLQQ